MTQKEAIIETNVLIDFVFDVSSVLLAASRSDIVYFKQSELIPLYDSFVSDLLPGCIFVTKYDDQDGKILFKVSRKLDVVDSLMAAIVIIKDKNELVGSTTLNNQLQVINLLMGSEDSSKASFEPLRALVDLGLAPYFEALSKLNHKDNLDEESSSIGSTRKKIGELALSLQQLQQLIRVPNLQDTVPKLIKEACLTNSDSEISAILESMDQDLISDSIFLNSLQSTVNGWTKAVLDITKLSYNLQNGTTKDEISFWISMESALFNIQDQLNSKEVLLVMEILRAAKRFHATVGFLSDTSIKDSLNISQKYNQLLKDLPIDEILFATNLDKLAEGIILTFNHLKKLRVSLYPIERAIMLVEAISADVDQTLKSIFSKIDLMGLSRSEFNEFIEEINSCFDLFDQNTKEFTGVARELLRKRSEKFILVKVNSKLVALQERVEFVASFRHKHGEWLDTVIKLQNNELLISDLDHAYSAVRNSDIFDMTVEGRLKWESCENLYNERTLKVQNSIIQMLRKQLALAKNSNEMFEIFDNFKFLLAQDSIRNAVQEYQSQLLSVLKKDIKNLQSQFFKQGEITTLFKLRDIPPVSATILWAKQIETRLDFLIDRCELILGENWRQFPEGQRLNSEVLVFKNKLNTRGIFEAWVNDSFRYTEKSMGDMSIFRIVKNPKSSNLEMVVTFDHSIMNLFKDVRHLCWLEYDVPHSIISMSRIIRKVYPHAIGISESLIVWTNSLLEVGSLDVLQNLMMLDVHHIMGLLIDLIPLKWNSLARLHDLLKVSDLDETHFKDFEELITLNKVTSMEESVSKFSNKLLSLGNTKIRLNKYLSELENCKYDPLDFLRIISTIQKIVNDIIFEGFAEVEGLASILNDKILEILIKRCSDKLTLWSSQIFQGSSEDTQDNLTSREHITIEISVKDQSISISPSLKSVKEIWFSQIQEQIDTVIRQKPVTTVAVNVEDEVQIGQDFTISKFDFDSLSTTASRCFDSVEATYEIISRYLDSWMTFQSLWDLDVDEVCETLSQDLQSWIELFIEFRETRHLFDTVETSKRFGTLEIQYEKIQSKINAKYEIWLRQISKRFSDVLGTAMERFFIKLSELKSTLENIDISNSISLITSIDVAQTEKSTLIEELETFQFSENILVKSRFRFPKNWKHVHQLNDTFASFEQILSRRLEFINQEKQTISQKIEYESVRLNEFLKKIVNGWELDKPVTGDLLPSSALNVLNTFEISLSNYNLERQLINTAARILDIHISSLPSLISLESELQDLKSVWLSLDSLWVSLQDYKKQEWLKISSNTVRHQLDDLLSRMRNMTAKVRQYTAFEDVQRLIKNYSKMNKFITDLKTDFIKSYHWESIFKQLNKSPIPLASLTLGDVWDLNILEHELLFNNIISQAAGERALEEQLDKIEETWAGLTFEFFNFKNKIRLVKKWDTLFEQVSDDINLLTSMQSSSYYGIFQQRGSLMNQRLDNLFSILDIWIEVQKQYVYLDGVFSGGEIKKMLLFESSKYENMAAEFLYTLKAVYKSLIVIDVLQVPDIEGAMKRILDSFVKIRQSLSEYLEKQRQLFPRFYFLGNEDLLEIVGNSHDIGVVERHFKSLFSGIAGSVYHGDKIISILSAEGEEVRLSQPVIINKNTSLQSWLTELEFEVKVTLSKNLGSAIPDMVVLFEEQTNGTENLLINFIDRYQLQIVILAAQVIFTTFVENSIPNPHMLTTLRNKYVHFLQTLAVTVLSETTSIQRRKYENLIIEFVYQKNLLDALIERTALNTNSFIWSSVQRYYYEEGEQDYCSRLLVKQSNASFVYGFEYFGVQPRLVHTPLIDKTFLAMSEALNQKMGGSPFGPAGTGKTESVKALGQNLGRMVLVFCCDESFDFQAMGRILMGICEIGAWACFDEFNRLDPKMLSAVSSQIEKIENALSTPSLPISLLGKNVLINSETGIFVTMNPGYAGRSELPENLKKLFRSFSMKTPDREKIAEVILNSQGFIGAGELANKVVSLFSKLEAESTHQIHYDFGLRALKSTLQNCGFNKRLVLNETSENPPNESQIVLRSLNETVAPKLTLEDELLFSQLCIEMFGNYDVFQMDHKMSLVVENKSLALDINTTDEFIKRFTQLAKIQETHHGIILYGDAGIGKSILWKTTLKVLGAYEEKDTAYHVIDCKTISKAELYGTLDHTTRDWTDGILTSILRKISENSRGELSKLTWIVLDGDVDPEWIENLNSVLDDTKMLTLPNGERILIPPNVKILFEVDSLAHATPATISRCAVIYIEKSLCSPFELYLKLMAEMKKEFALSILVDHRMSGSLDIFELTCRSMITPEVLTSLLDECSKLEHILRFNVVHTLRKFQIMLASNLRKLLNTECDDPAMYSRNAVLVSICWAFSGDTPDSSRVAFEKLIATSLKHQQQEIQPRKSFLDLVINPQTGKFMNIEVPSTILEHHEVTKPDVVIPTSDTIKHEELIHSVISEHVPLIMCGPPGSGKTLTFLSVLRKSPNLDFVDLNFSKESSPELLIKTMEQYCDYRASASHTLMVPKLLGKWLVVFVDELNLPKADKFGTQKVICLLRQMIERNGFYKNGKWIELSNIQFVGACNPSSDPGRYEMSMRFLRNTMVVSVNYPSFESLSQIYGAMLRATLGSHNLAQYTNDITKVVVNIYEHLRNAFQHDVISPRDLSRIVKGLHTYLDGATELDELLRLLVFNSLRVFSDRFSDNSKRSSVMEIITGSIRATFPTVVPTVFKSPILISNWLSLSYKEVSEVELRSFVSERLRVFCEEELDVNFVIYDDLLDHVLRIDRVLKQPQGHLILIGPSGSGKTTLTKFVSWINGYKVLQLFTSTNFTLNDFDIQLKDILRRVVIQNERISFIIDESNILETSFMERMNNLLSSCEIPGLFENDEMRTMANNSGIEDIEFAAYFKRKIAENLHVVFTISDTQRESGIDLLSSPALLNRCVVNWMGNWSDLSMLQVGMSLIQPLAIEETYENHVAASGQSKLGNHREALIGSLIFCHDAALNIGASFEFTPSHYLDFINHFNDIYKKKENSLQEYHKHITVGLENLRDTVLTLKSLKSELSQKNERLKLKNEEANDMLSQMLSEQNEAERKREASIELQIALEAQEKELEIRRGEVLGDLALAEPAVLEALRGVKNIKKEHLNELRAMNKPPNSVILTLESVCSLLGHETRSWRDVQAIIRGETFISDIVNFNNEEMCSPEVITFMEEKYLSREDYNYAAANRGSKACGPLLQWVVAQVKFASILDEISPLKLEVDALQAQALQNKRKLKVVDEMIHDLETSIDTYKENYSTLIRETENIRTEMKLIKQKVERSENLVNDLTEERERWRLSVKTFHTERSNLAGDTVLAAMFLTYCGCLDQKGRFDLLKAAKQHLQLLKIPYDENFNTVNYLSNPDDLVTWRHHGLLNDDLFVENMVIIQNAKLSPVIIDPSRKIVELLLALESSKPTIVTSFLDDGFVKHLENALRFGSPILIENAEHFNPIISSLLNNEIQRVGNRKLVRLGKQTIDCVPGFKLMISTKDSSFKLPSFVFCRTSVANFTLTESSIITQFLDLSLGMENPEVEAQKMDLMKLSGEYKVRLRKLEDSLLASLSETRGNILDDENIVITLQNLKTELTQIEIKVKETTNVMKTVDTILEQYYPLASTFTKVYLLAQSFKGVSQFYQFSLDYFMAILRRVLLEKIETSMSRLDYLILRVYQELFARMSLSMQNKDKIVLAVCMFLLYNGPHSDISITQLISEVVNYLKPSADSHKSLAKILEIVGMSLDEDLSSLSTNHQFLLPMLSSLKIFEKEPTGLMQALAEMCQFLWKEGTSLFESCYTIKDIVSGDKDPRSPTVLVSPEGLDASFKIQHDNMITIAMGSNEATEMAKTELLNVSKSGGWLLLQNVQMAPEWLDQLEKLLSSIVPSPGFRLFLTCNFGSSIPVSVLRDADVFVFENTPGVKPIMRECFNGVKDRVKNRPVEQRHLYFLLAWFHAVVQERLRYIPVGFKKEYDFNNSDFNAACFVIEQMMSKIAGGRSNIDPAIIEWELLQVLIGEIIYGGKVDILSDAEVIKNLAKKIFVSNSFDFGFQLAESLSPPEGRSVDEYCNWISQLPETQSPNWIGLDSDVEDKVSVELAGRTLQMVHQLICE